MPAPLPSPGLWSAGHMHFKEFLCSNRLPLLAAGDLCADPPVLPSFSGLLWPHSNVAVLDCRLHSVGPSRMCPAPYLPICPPPASSPSCPHAEDKQHGNITFSQKLASYSATVFGLAFPPRIDAHGVAMKLFPLVLCGPFGKLILYFFLHRW